MNNNVVIVVGTQWGDEGKGKVVDWLSKNADAVVRFQGGNNAGHTIIISDKVYKLNLLPSSILRPQKMSIIGNGVVVDPYALIQEIENLKKYGIQITPENLLIAENAPLVLSIHKQADELFEKLRKNNNIGTTKRGIGPCYEDKIGRRAIRAIDLLNKSVLEEKIEELLNYHNIIRKGAGENIINKSDILQELLDITPQIIPYIKPVWKILNDLIKNNKKVVFEGAQGVLLDVDHGTYPYVTSSNTLPTQIGAGTGVNKNCYVLGITKAYTTRVGNGPFFTEQNNEIGDLLFNTGNEVGTVSNRRRRCGWFDAVLTRQSITISGVSGIVLTKLDILDNFDTVKICVAYKYKDQIFDYLPHDSSIYKDLCPVYEEIPGWKVDTHGKLSIDELPENARNYIKRIETLLGVPVVMISTSPQRKDMIVIDNSLEFLK